MDGDKKRKRAPRHSACIRCKNAHRVCDGGRPCRRCIERGREEFCQSAPQKEEIPTRVKQRSFLVVKKKSYTVARAPQGCQSIFEQTSPTTGTPFAKHNIEQSIEKPITNEHQPLLLALLNQIRDLNDTTHTLLATQHSMSTQVNDLKRRITQGNDFDLSTQPQHYAPYVENVSEEYYNSPEYIFSEVADEFNDLIMIEHEQPLHLVPSVLTVSRDTVRFKESQGILPFVVQSAIDPFVVFAMNVDDWDLFKSMTALGIEMRNPGGMFRCLTANPSFLALTQYSEDELIANMQNLFPRSSLPPDEQKAFLSLIFPEPDVHASAPMLEHPLMRARDGSILMTEARGQFFYVDGHVSFIVCTVLSATQAPEGYERPAPLAEIPQQQQLPPPQQQLPPQQQPPQYQQHPHAVIEELNDEDILCLVTPQCTYTGREYLVEDMSDLETL